MTALLAQAADANSGGDLFLLLGFGLLGVAAILLVIELVLPSGGLISIVAGLVTLGSIFSFFRHSSTAGIIATTAYVVLGPILLVLIFRVWMRSPLGRNMILGGYEEEERYDSEAEAAAAAEQARRERVQESRKLIGAEGVTVTALRPIGMVKIGNERLDAMAETSVIPANTPIVVTNVYDNQVKVRPRSA